MYQNKNASEEEFLLRRFDRITKEQISSLEKALSVTIDENAKKKLLDQKAHYIASREAERKPLVAKLEAAKKAIVDNHTDYTTYDLSKLNALTEVLLKSYDQGLLKRYKDSAVALEKIYSEFSSLDGDLFVRALERHLQDFLANVALCRDELALEKDEHVYTLGVTLKHLIKEYYSRKRAEAKAAKLAEKNAKKKAAGKSTDLTAKQRAWASEINTSSSTKIERMKHQISTFIELLKGPYITELDANLATEAIKAEAAKYARAFTDNIVTFSHPSTNAEITERAIELMGLVGIAEPSKRIKQYPFEFSGGMRQRIVIAIALSSNPEILICDEPTTALDVTIQAQILELINDLKKKLNLSIIFITHNLGVVANMADYIAVMYAGKIIEYGTVDEIFYQPKHPYTWALLASMPDLETKTKLDAIPGAPPNMIIPPKGDAFAARNKYAMAIDFEQQPPRFQVSPTHWAATWLLAKGAPKVVPPEIVTERIERMQKRYGGKD